MALITDKFHKASNGTRAEATTLTAQKGLGASSISTAALNGWPTDTPVDFQIYNTDTNNNIVPGSQSDWVGIVSGTTITQIQLTGGSDDIYPIGAIVVGLPTANWADSMVEGILIHSDPDGTLKAGSIDTTAVLADGVVTSAKIADGTIVTTDISTNGVGASNIATNALTLGYTEITSNFNTTSVTPVQVTGLTVNVTVPAGGRRLKITAYAPGLYVNSPTAPATMSIWQGTVGSGVQKTRTFGPGANGGSASGATAIASYVLAAGSYTFNVGVAAGAGTATVEAAATYPAFILVELI